MRPCQQGPSLGQFLSKVTARALRLGSFFRFASYTCGAGPLGAALTGESKSPVARLAPGPNALSAQFLCSGSGRARRPRRGAGRRTL